MSFQGWICNLQFNHFLLRLLRLLPSEFVFFPIFEHWIYLFIFSLCVKYKLTIIWNGSILSIECNQWFILKYPQGYKKTKRYLEMRKWKKRIFFGTWNETVWLVFTHLSKLTARSLFVQFVCSHSSLCVCVFGLSPNFWYGRVNAVC